MPAQSWKRSDPLFRGDGPDGPVLPLPCADASIVRHILYLDGVGRRTPYLSATESKEVAKTFAGTRGRVRSTQLSITAAKDVTHISRAELVTLLVGRGKGNAAWTSAYDVMQARKYVELWLEHLLNFRQIENVDESSIESLVDQIFEASK